MIRPLIACMLLVCACDDPPPTADTIQQNAQETILKEATAQTGMPAIKNFRERKFLKEILELRDQAGLNTFTYLWSDMQGRWKFFCTSVGYGLPYATQYTSPEKVQYFHTGGGVSTFVVPQADPNGLFSPSSADGTWVLCKDPAGPDVRPVFLEPRIIVTPFRMDDDSVQETTAIKITPSGKK